VPDADIAMVFDMPSRWIMQRYPPLSRPDGTPDERAYQGIFEPLYRGTFNAGLQVRILHAAQLTEDLVRDYPVPVVPSLYIAGDQTLDLLRSYALAGGHLVLGPRTGYADTEARARADPGERPALRPGRLSLGHLTIMPGHRGLVSECHRHCLVVPFRPLCNKRAIRPIRPISLTAVDREGDDVGYGWVLP
jgi:beta-galactosidase GanA